MAKFHASRARRNGTGAFAREKRRMRRGCWPREQAIIALLIAWRWAGTYIVYRTLLFYHRSLWAFLWWRVCNLRLFLSLSLFLCVYLSLWDILEMKRSTCKNDNDVTRETRSVTRILRKHGPYFSLFFIFFPSEPSCDLFVSALALNPHSSSPSCDLDNELFFSQRQMEAHAVKRLISKREFHLPITIFFF